MRIRLLITVGPRWRMWSFDLGWLDIVRVARRTLVRLLHAAPHIAVTVAAVEWWLSRR